MNDQCFQRAKHTKGFTLIELLVVIAIIGLLSSIVLASLNTARAKGRDAALFEGAKQLMIALELYRNQYNAYPPSVGSCPSCLYDEIKGSATDPVILGDLAPYMSSLPNPGTFTNTDKSSDTTSRLLYRVLTHGSTMPPGCTAAGANCYALLLYPEAASSLGPANTAIYFLSNGEVRNGYNMSLY